MALSVGGNWLLHWWRRYIWHLFCCSRPLSAAESRDLYPEGRNLFRPFSRIAWLGLSSTRGWTILRYMDTHRHRLMYASIVVSHMYAIALDHYWLGTRRWVAKYKPFDYWVLCAFWTTLGCRWRHHPRINRPDGIPATLIQDVLC